MFDVMLSLHLLAAVFVIGPLAHATSTAVRGLRHTDASATASAARTVTIYTYVSILVIIFGFGLMSATSPYTGESVAQFGETWIWLSLVLWIIAGLIALLVTAPGLKQATARIGNGEAVDSLRGKIAASGGVVALLFAVIVVLMVYQPGA